MLFSGLKAEFKRHAAENQSDQHDGQRSGQSRGDDRISQRECAIQSSASEDQPGFVAVPDGRDGVNHHVALNRIFIEREQDTDAKVETIHDDVHQGGENDDHKPDNGEIDSHLIFPLPMN